MARELTSAIEAAAAAGTVRPAFLVDLHFDSGTGRIWTGIGPFDWNGAVYSGVGSLLDIAGIEEAAETSAKGMTLTLAGIPQDLLAIALAEPYQGRLAEIRLALFAEDGTMIADPVLVFSGRMDVMPIDEGAQTATIGVTVESRLVDLERARERRYTHEDQQIDYPGDLGFEFVASLQDVEIKWGRT